MILPTAYLPPISWYHALFAEQCEVEIWESFEKQTLRNRCRIMGPNGVQTLTVPVEKCEHKQLTKDVKIVRQSKWQHEHRHALTSAYKNTPFFDYYADFFLPLYEKHYTFLVDWNEALHDVVAWLLLQREFPLCYTQQWKGVELSPIEPRKPYYQIFADKQGWQPDLSIVDLLFNMGPESLLYI